MPGPDQPPAPPPDLVIYESVAGHPGRQSAATDVYIANAGGPYIFTETVSASRGRSSAVSAEQQLILSPGGGRSGAPGSMGWPEI